MTNAPGVENNHVQNSNTAVELNTIILIRYKNKDSNTYA
jgi:hypothetical protein